MLEFFAFQLKVHGQALCVKLPSATLRAEPKISAATTWIVSKYTPLLRLDRRGSWYKVQDMDGELHWIHSSSVTSDYHCLTVRVNITSLRQGPGKQYPIVERPVADRYTNFKRLGNEDDWYQVEDVNGVKGWVNESNVWRPTITQNISF